MATREDLVWLRQALEEILPGREIIYYEDRNVIQVKLTPKTGLYVMVLQGPDRYILKWYTSSVWRDQRQFLRACGEVAGILEFIQDETHLSMALFQKTGD